MAYSQTLLIYIKRATWPNGIGFVFMQTDTDYICALF